MSNRTVYVIVAVSIAAMAAGMLFGGWTWDDRIAGSIAFSW